MPACFDMVFGLDVPDGGFARVIGSKIGKLAQMSAKTIPIAGFRVDHEGDSYWAFSA